MPAALLVDCGSLEHVEYPVAGVKGSEAHGKDDPRVLVDHVHVLDLRYGRLDDRGAPLDRVQHLRAALACGGEANGGLAFELSVCSLVSTVTLPLELRYRRPLRLLDPYERAMRKLGGNLAESTLSVVVIVFE